MNATHLPARLKGLIRRADPEAEARNPSALTFTPSALRIGTKSVEFPEQTCASFAVVGYPREVGAGWLEPLLTYPGRLDVSLHIEPIPPLVAAQRLRRQLARLESSSRADARAGRLADFAAEAAAEDAAELSAALARGNGKLFRVGLYLTIYAPDAEALEAESQQVRALAASLLLDAQPTTFRAIQGWISSLPLGTDPVKQRRSFDTSALAASFPFASPDLNAPIGTTGVLYGLNISSSGVVLWDRYAQDNHNSVVLARSGAGKSYFTKLETLRLLYHGVEIAVIDPEDEYRRLAEAVGGTHIALGAEGVSFNPFDLPETRNVDVLTRRALFIQTLVSAMLGEELPPAARAALDKAVLAAYASKGISADRATWGRPAPLLADLVEQLTISKDTEADHIAARLAPYVAGSYKELFAAATTTRPGGHLTVFSLRALPDEIKSVGVLLALDSIWRRVSDPVDRRPRLVVVDEAWLLMKEPEGAKFLYRLAKSARKYWAGLAVITQDAADLLSSDLGRAVVSNAATQVLLRQSPQAIGAVVEAFNLSDGERAFLLSADRGEGLLCGGNAGDRAAFAAVASPTEHQLVTTNPAEIAELEAAGEEDDPL
ncbi:ATP-binding protein [Actinomadura sp. B10D3]|uniref:VirB4 family type IV secretion system protein n=1 Tax=Actinomadura sp. B10D3 TaxID=3153557 RepID=UPI00325DA2DE